jgi:hypothetical protein
VLGTASLGPAVQHVGIDGGPVLRRGEQACAVEVDHGHIGEGRADVSADRNASTSLGHGTTGHGTTGHGTTGHGTTGHGTTGHGTTGHGTTGHGTTGSGAACHGTAGRGAACWVTLVAAGTLAAMPLTYAMPLT